MPHRGPSTKHGVRSAVSAHQPTHAAVLVQPAAIDHRSLTVQSASPTGVRAIGRLYVRPW